MSCPMPWQYVNSKHCSKAVKDLKYYNYVAKDIVRKMINSATKRDNA